MAKITYMDKSESGGIVTFLDGYACAIAVNPHAVDVRLFKEGFIGRLSLIIPRRKLRIYHENDIYDASKVAMLLASEFPAHDDLRQLKNVVFASFANAMLYCATGGQACYIIGQAKEKAAKLDADALEKMQWDARERYGQKSLFHRARQD